MSLSPKKIEIFCGTGGVGKTTISTSRAMKLAGQGYKVLLITIDPARRLKQILGLDDDQSGEVTSISSHSIGSSLKEEEEFHFDALLMSPSHTLKRIAKRSGDVNSFDNYIFKTLTKPNGGMNEIMAILEVQYWIDQQAYDVIVLDTPPGKHFIDFLEGTGKLSSFFDKTFVDIFKVFGKAPEKSKRGFGLIRSVIDTGIKKLLSYLESVTGGEFITDFIDAISILYKNREFFLEAIKFQEQLRKKEFSNWFLVTSIEHQKISEALLIREKAKDYMHEDNYFIINKCLGPFLNNWYPDSPQFKKLKASLEQKEKDLLEFSESSSLKTLQFAEIISASPEDHVAESIKYWP